MVDTKDIDLVRILSEVSRRLSSCVVSVSLEGGGEGEHSALRFRVCGVGIEGGSMAMTLVFSLEDLCLAYDAARTVADLMERNWRTSGGSQQSTE